LLCGVGCLENLISFPNLSYKRSIDSFRSVFYTHCDVLLTLSIPSILSFPEGHPVAVASSSSSSRHVCTSFNSMFQKAVPTQTVTTSLTLPSFLFLYSLTLSHATNFDVITSLVSLEHGVYGWEKVTSQ
jgi:hypothetical protein